MKFFEFDIEARSDRARAARLRTPHGVIHTPIFMPVGTAGSVKGLTATQLEEIGAQIILANTYHMHVRPGEDLVRELGGLHGFTGFTRPFLTDSGGYQVMSLAALRKRTEESVVFRSHLDGARLELSPERSIDIQMKLGADIIMAFDECPPWPATREEVIDATERTARWAERSKRAHTREDQWLFGIVQGGVHDDIRALSARAITSIGFPGYAIGGLSVGEPKEDMVRVLDTKIYFPDTLTIYPQLMNFGIQGGLEVGTSWAYPTGGETFNFKVKDNTVLRISLFEVPAGKYRVFIDYAADPQGCEFSLWQRQTQQTAWINSYQESTSRKEQQFLITIKLTNLIKTISFHF